MRRCFAPTSTPVHVNALAFALALTGCPANDQLDADDGTGSSTGGGSSDGSTTEDPEAPTSVGTTGETGTLDDTGSDTGGEPLPVSTPRQLAPLSGATVSSRTPLLELELDDGTAGVSIELCADRQCETILADFELEGPQGVPPMELPTGRVYWRAFGQTGDEQNETPTPTWELWVPNKASAPNDIWYDVSHDIDGDGFDDFLSPAATKIVVRGSARGLGEPYDLEALPIDAYAPLSAVGDVNGDGFADLGVPGAHDRAVAIVYGGADGPNPENATILSEDEAFLFGTSVVSVGDVNRDGYGDIAVGTTDVGIADDAFVWIFPGGPDGVSTTPLNRLHESMPDCDPSCGSFTFGQYPVGCDVNGDRRTDIIADGRYGFYVFEASATGIGTLPSILPHFYGRAPSCGDVDGDGFGDLIVGRSSNQGEHNDEIWIYFGSPQGLSVDNSSVVHTLPAPTGPVPAIVAMLGDVDGDGFDDIGTTVFETFDEYAFVIPGAPGGPVQSVSLELSRAGNFLGHGDLNADGLRDFSVGGGLPSCAQRIFAGTSEPPFPLIGGWSGLTGPCEP